MLLILEMIRNLNHDVIASSPGPLSQFLMFPLFACNIKSREGGSGDKATVIDVVFVCIKLTSHVTCYLDLLNHACVYLLSSFRMRIRSKEITVIIIQNCLIIDSCKLTVTSHLPHDIFSILIIIYLFVSFYSYKITSVN